MLLGINLCTTGKPFENDATFVRNIHMWGEQKLVQNLRVEMMEWSASSSDINHTLALTWLVTRMRKRCQTVVVAYGSSTP